MINLIFLFSTSAISKANLIIALVGYLIVFVALVMLYFVFYSFPKLINLFNRKKSTKGTVNKEEVMSGEVNAAIAMALYLFYNEYHDEESNILTIKKTSKTYSPWSSKIYSVRNSFNRI